MRNVTYWPGAHRLVYQEKKATPEFWDETWAEKGPAAPIRPSNELLVYSKKYLAPGARVLEGGCGRANKVQALKDAGFDPIGIDFGEQTVAQAHKDYPDIDVRMGDVRALDFEDNAFDGYWSLGVIEHFWEGYDAIFKEASRVLKPGAYFFLTAPWFSPYRQRVARKGRFDAVEYGEEPTDFYQFALPRDEVVKNLKAHDFDIVGWHGIAAAFALTREARTARGTIDWLFGSRGSLPKRVLRKVVSESLNGFMGHSFLAIAKRR